MADVLIEVDHLSYQVSNQDSSVHPILQDISFTIRAGEWVALLGANGSGKTTLVRHLNALLQPSSGSVRVDGMDTRDKRHRPLIRATAGMVFQNPEDQIVAGVVEEDTAFGPENLAIAPPEIRRRVNEALAQVGLSAQHLRPPHLLSAGQKQRLAIAGVLAMRPRLIILDEASTMLDPGGRRAVMDIMRQLHAEGMTIILISHFMQEAVNADRVIILNRGRLVADSSPKKIFSSPSQLVDWGLEQPPAAAIASQLRLHLPDFPAGILTSADLLKAISSLPHQPTLTNYPTNLSHPPAPAAIIEVNSLAHEYMTGTPLAHQALLDVSCSIPQGSGYALLGATGSGKSTLLQHLNGLLRPQEGRVRVGSFDLTDPKVNTRSVVQMAGLVFQNPENQFFEQYVGDEIAYGPRQFSLDEPLAERVRWAMNMVGLDFEDFKDRLTFSLSGGERRKVALASILALKPQILLLDEPLAGLDPASRRAILARLAELRQQVGVSLVLSSHQMEDVAALAQGALVLANGRSVMQDCLGCVFAQPDQLAAAGLAAPLAARLAADLRSQDWNLAPNLLTPVELVEGILASIQIPARRGG
jgi:energy-coupling factor transport system ATP-binding protein